MFKTLKITLCFILLGLTALGGEKYTITGHVNDSLSGEPLIGVVIHNEDFSFSTSTNFSGFYSITVNKGDYKLTFLHTEYNPRSIAVELSNDKNIDVLLSKSNLQIKAVKIDVSVASQKQSQKVKMSSLNIPIQQIQEISVLGENDPLKIAQMTPGVQSGGEATPGLFVRGSKSEHNLFILDDATYYNPFHLFGVYSVINSDALGNFEIIKGGFPARYGGRLASVVDLDMKEGNKKELKGKAKVGAIMSKLYIEAPIGKKTSFFVSGRGAYGHLLARPYIDDLKETRLFFYDFNGKVTHQINEKHKLFFGGGHSSDVFGLNDDPDLNPFFKLNINWQNTTSTLRLHSIINKKLFANNALIYSRFKLSNNIWSKVVSHDGQEIEDFYDLLFDSQIKDYSYKSDFTYYHSPKHTVRFGGVFTAHNFDPSATVYKNKLVEDSVRNNTPVSAYESAIYVEDEWKLTKKVTGNIGMRLSHFNNEGHNIFNPEPRALLKYKVNKRSAVNLSYSQMNQYTHLLTTRGVGFPTDLWVPSSKDIPNENSIQYALGYVLDFTKINSYLSIEGYYKRMKNVVSFEEGTTFMQNNYLEDINPEDLVWDENLTFGEAEAYGAEFMFHRKKGKFNGWLSYTLAWSKSQFDDLNLGQPFYNRNDRRHQINFVSVYNISQRWKANLSWVFQSGNPTTVANGVVTESDKMTLPGEGIGNSQIPDEPSALFYYSGLNNYRMPNYHRMDISFKYSFKESKKGSDLEFGVYNVYNRKNVFFYYLNTGGGSSSVDQVTILPIMPFVNYSFAF